MRSVILVAAAVAALAIVPGSMSAPTAGNGDEPVATARSHVQANAAELGVGSADVADLFVTSAVRSDHSGVTHVNLNQRYRDLEVFGGHVTVNVAANGRVIFAAGSLVPRLSADPSGDVELEPAEAVEAAAAALDLEEPQDVRVVRRQNGPARETTLSAADISDAPIPARLGWQPTENGLRKAWQLVIDDSSDVHLWKATVDAETGELLESDDWTSDDTAATLSSTLGRAGGSASRAFAADAFGIVPPNRAADGSSYRVFQLPANDANEGPRNLVSNPGEALASPFGWHDTNGVAGPEFTITRGNNVYAYTDRDANNQIDPGSEPSGGPTLTFDFPLDLNEHPQTYVPASVTNLFYWCNIVHDLSYQYGFTEPFGNFQVNNYGRGGNGGDDVPCEGQDGSGENNANFSTPAADGGRPRMQMFLWPGNQFGLPNAVTVDLGLGAGTYEANYARFSPAPTSAGLAGTFVLVSDGVGTVTDGCQPYALPAGSIALVDNSTTCNAYTRATNAQNAGAVALVVAHNTAATPPVLSGSMNPPVAIPAVTISQANGNAIKAGLPATGSVHRNLNRPAMRDADLRSETIFHEYGHGVSLRLTGGPGINCLNGDEQAGEGWSDYLAISALLRPELDDPEGPRGYGQFALFADSRVGPGFRPRPYSRNMEIQPFTYDSIRTGAWLAGTSLALPHGLGHGWAAVLWDMTWELIDKHGFHANVYEAANPAGNTRAIRYVMDGLKIQGCSPGLVVARNAIIAAAAAVGGEDTCTIWAAFARRGLGYGAVQGTTNRNDNSEAFDTHPDCRRGFQPPVHASYGALDEVDAGATVPLRFGGTGLSGLDILASNSPFSRKVDCATLRVPSVGTAITPRELPVPASPPGKSGLSRTANGVYLYPWKTLESWAGSCRELVLTRKDGKQHRAFFRFLAAEEASG